MTRRVLVTGASTGIGAASVRALLDHGGLDVWATARDAEDLKALEERGATPIHLELQDPDDIERVADEVGPLWGLVNNAGVSVSGGVADLTPGDWRDQFEINVFGPLDLTRRLLPGLRDQQGRVVWVGSQLGRFTMPFMAAYCASKHALESVAAAMRMECGREGIQVSLVAPGPVRTAFNENAKRQVRERMDLDRAHHAQTYKDLLSWEGEMGMTVDAEVVAADVLHALTHDRPKARYEPGASSRWSSRALRALPTRMRDAALIKGYEG